jgi:hypothetical protein
MASERKRKQFNLTTLKLHLLGHYVPTIRLFGSTPGFSTAHVSPQTLTLNIYLQACSLYKGELAHRKVKRRYQRVSKANHALGLTKLERREAIMREIDERVERFRNGDISQTREEDKLPYTDPSMHYHISAATKESILIGTILRENEGDPAIKVSPL